MAQQLDMFGAPAPAKKPRRPSAAQVNRQQRREAAERELDARFELFHKANPHVLAEMLKLAREELDKGARYLSAKKLWEDLRSWLRTTGQPFKLNNNLTSSYARKLTQLEPRLADVIRFRGQR